MKRNVICIVCGSLTGEGLLEEIGSLLAYLRGLRERTSNPDAAKAEFKIISPSSQDGLDLGTKKDHLLQKWGAEFSNDIMELSSSLAVICHWPSVREYGHDPYAHELHSVTSYVVPDCREYDHDPCAHEVGRPDFADIRKALKSVEDRTLQAAEARGANTGRSQRWEISPVSLLVRLFPVRWYEGRIVEDAFPNEPFVDLPKTLKSPFASAAHAIRTCPVYRDPLGRELNAMLERSQVGDPFRVRLDPSVDLNRALEDVDRIILHADPEVSGRYYFDLDESRVRWCDGSGSREFQIESETRSGGIPIICLRAHSYYHHAYGRADALLYLIITGAVKKPIPLRIAMAVRDPSFAWNLRMSELSKLGGAFEDIPAFPLSGVTVHDIVLENNDLVLGRGESKTVVSEGWRGHTDSIIGDWRPSAPSEAEQTSLPPLQPAEELMRHSKQLVWLSGSTPPEPLTLLCPDAIKLADLLPHVDECLKMWRGQQVGAAGKDGRAIPSASFPHQEIVLPIAEGLYRTYTPWPDPLKLRDDSDESWQWSPEKCLESVRPMFKELSSASLRDEPPSLLANFLYLIRSDRMICHAWPTRATTGWHFKLRTQDHTWITGVVWSLPEHVDQRHDASESSLQTEESSDFSCRRVTIRYANICCEIEEGKK